MITTLSGDKPFANSDLTYKAYELDGFAALHWFE